MTSVEVCEFWPAVSRVDPAPLVFVVLTGAPKSNHETEEEEGAIVEVVVALAFDWK